MHLKQPHFGDVISPVAEDEPPLDIVQLADQFPQSPHGNVPRDISQAVLKSRLKIKGTEINELKTLLSKKNICIKI